MKVIVDNLEEEIRKQEEVVASVSETSSAYANGYQQGRLDLLRELWEKANHE